LLVPRPAAGIIAFLIFLFIDNTPIFYFFRLYIFQ
jgi:hypothetical protein